MGDDPIVFSLATRCSAVELRGRDWWEVDEIEPLAPQGPRLQRGDGTSLSSWHFPFLVAGPGVAPGRRGV